MEKVPIAIPSCPECGGRPATMQVLDEVATLSCPCGATQASKSVRTAQDVAGLFEEWRRKCNREEEQ